MADQIYICVTPFFPTPDSFRGPYIYDQVKAIRRTGKYDVMVFKPTTLNDKRDSYEYEGITVHLFPSVQMPSFFFNGLSNGFNCSMFLKCIARLELDISTWTYLFVCRLWDLIEKTESPHPDIGTTP